MKCPRCGNDCDRDSVDVGVGVINGPWGCYCGWSEDPRYDLQNIEQDESGHRDQWGGFTPSLSENHCSKIFDHKWLDPQCVESGCQSLQDRLPFAFLDLLKSNGMPDGLNYGDQHAWLFRHFVRHESYRSACRIAEEEIRTLQSALTNAQGTEAESNGVAMMLEELLYGT